MPSSALSPMLLLLFLAPLAAVGTGARLDAPVPDAQPPWSALRQPGCDSASDLRAQVRGRIEGGVPPGDPIRVFLFDGVSVRSTITSPDGSFCLPVPDSVSGPYVSVFLVRDTYFPEVRNLRIGERGTNAVVDIPNAVPGGGGAMRRTADPDNGTLTGVAYVRAVGGRLEPQQGIGSYDPRLTLRIERQPPAVAGAARPVTVRTSSTGEFSVELPPGVYRIITSRNVVIENVRILPGQTTVQPVFSGESITS